ncbi:Ribosomal large subunit pseudouridine synthase C [Neolewinella maritima]|uniref:Ribosomal large subunit pseudouridine synthase C n=1 Tax=Neolewinella maritima TaxID=1383882 RepID=A0ABM9AYG5_9BACT|nr:RluA family pseudouridine synthase [Neolewinella maritima]CAH0999546.1 Ribosomal large subunit pseudouridine synthase C [Neolewinella maritima]
MLEILREGPGWAVINKPAGIATERHFQYDTVEARAQVQWQRAGAKKAAYVGIVHRLDRPVSGALLLARKKSVLIKLNQAFAERLTQKVYRAVTQQPLPAANGELVHYLGRTPDRKKAFASTRPVPDTQEARLSYRLLREVDGRYEYELQPVTGRFHQLRIQLATVGAPIVGDLTYGNMLPLRDNIIALHAYSLAFPDPGTEATIEVEAPLPDYWPLPL